MQQRQRPFWSRFTAPHRKTQTAARCNISFALCCDYAYMEKTQGTMGRPIVDAHTQRLPVRCHRIFQPHKRAPIFGICHACRPALAVPSVSRSDITCQGDEATTHTLPEDPCGRANTTYEGSKQIIWKQPAACSATESRTPGESASAVKPGLQYRKGTCRIAQHTYAQAEGVVQGCCCPCSWLWVSWMCSAAAGRTPGTRIDVDRSSVAHDAPSVTVVVESGCFQAWN